MSIRGKQNSIDWTNILEKLATYKRNGQNIYPFYLCTAAIKYNKGA